MKYPLYRYSVRFTEEQRQVMESFAKARGLERPQDILQSLAQEYFEREGTEWPLDYPRWGGSRKRKTD